MRPRKVKKLPPLERQVESRCDRYLTDMGWKVVRFSIPKRKMVLQTAGIPDRKYYRGARTFWFECKAEGGRQSPEQKAFQAMCELAGETYVLGGFEEIERFVAHTIAPISETK